MRPFPGRQCQALLLFALAAGATFAIWNADPMVQWAYQAGVFLLAGWVVSSGDLPCGPILTAAALLAAWGFVQLAAGATVYRYPTLAESLRVAALAATALCAVRILRQKNVLLRWLRWFTWFAFVVSVVALVAYYTSPGRILWWFRSPYPDVWGPFLSRNNFAQFLELALPVSLWLGCEAHGTKSPARAGPIYFSLGAVMLGAGLVSASRAGAVLLVIETVAVFVLARPAGWRRSIPRFALGALALATLAGGEVLVDRLRESDPWRDRREIFASSWALAAARPFTGYGLGNFATVYPGFARFDPGKTVEHAHNDWLEWAVEGGWPYAAAWLLLALAAFGPARRSIWGLGVPAVFVHALVDDPFARCGVVAWLFILAGALENNQLTTAPVLRAHS